MEITRYECPKCKDTGFILCENENGLRYAAPCTCKEIKEARARLERSGLAKEFKAKTFDNFRTCNKPILEEAKNMVMHYADVFRYIRNTTANSLLLCGQAGAGKTHLGTACSIKLIDQGTPVIYMGYRDGITALKGKIIDAAAYSADMRRYKNAQVLFIDDFLKGRTTESDVNIVYEIVNYRYNNNLPVIISTEKKPGELIEFDEAIASRLLEMCYSHIIIFSGEELNYRLYKGGVA